MAEDRQEGFMQPTRTIDVSPSFALLQLRTAQADIGRALPLDFAILLMIRLLRPTTVATLELPVLRSYTFAVTDAILAVRAGNPDQLVSACRDPHCQHDADTPELFIRAIDLVDWEFDYAYMFVTHPEGRQVQLGDDAAPHRCRTCGIHHRNLDPLVDEQFDERVCEAFVTPLNKDDNEPRVTDEDF